MFRNVAISLPILLFIFVLEVGAQEFRKQYKVRPKLELRQPSYSPICYMGEQYGVNVPNIRTTKNSNFKTTAANIEIVYNGFDGIPEAKDAFQYAVDIWSALIESPVTIRIEANYETLGTGVLGSATTTQIIRNFDNTPQFGVWYPIALAEKIARREINSSNAFDIETNFNSQASWYFDTDNPAAIDSTGLFDFASVVLHELTHGLGFSSFVDIENNEGSIGFAGFPMCYTTSLKHPLDKTW